MSRRRALKLLLAGAGAGLLSAVAAPGAYAARKCRTAGQTCQSDAQCCTRYCDNQTFKCGCPPTSAGLCQNKQDTCLAECTGGRVPNLQTCECVCPSEAPTPCGETCCPSGFSCTDAGTCCPTNRLCAGECCPPGFTCSNNQCVATACGATTCPAGCCQNNVCVTPQLGTSGTPCGTGGATCVTCNAPNVCCGPPSLGQCKRPSNATCSGNGQCCSNNCLPTGRCL